MVRLFPLLFVAACGGSEPSIEPACQWSGLHIGTLYRPSHSSCTLQDQKARVTFEYSPIDDVYWIHYLATISIDVDSGKVDNELVIRTVDGAGDVAVSGYYSAKFSGHATVQDDNAGICLLAEIGVAGQPKPSEMTFQTDTVCRSDQ